MSGGGSLSLVTQRESGKGLVILVVMPRQYYSGMHNRTKKNSQQENEKIINESYSLVL